MPGFKLGHRDWTLATDLGRGNGLKSAYRWIGDGETTARAGVGVLKI